MTINNTDIELQQNNCREIREWENNVNEPLLEGCVTSGETVLKPY